MCKPGVAATVMLVEVTSVRLALVVLLLGLRLSYGFYEKLLLLTFCGFAILNASPERLPGGLTPRSPHGTGGYEPYDVCLPHATAKRCPSSNFLFLYLRRLPFSKTKCNAQASGPGLTLESPLPHTA